MALTGTFTGHCHAVHTLADRVRCFGAAEFFLSETDDGQGTLAIVVNKGLRDHWENVLPLATVRSVRTIDLEVEILYAEHGRLLLGTGDSSALADRLLNEINRRATT